MGYTTEEEQVEALRNWWRENGTSILVGVALALGAVFGWQWWQQQETGQAQAASALYQDLQDAWDRVSRPTGDDKSQQAARATLQHLAESLKSEHAKTAYASMAALHVARFRVEQDELDAAADELNWVIAQQASPRLVEIARLRLAQVLLARQDAAAALAVLDAHAAESLAAEWEELRGDALLRLERRDEAIRAYQRANDIATAQGQRRPILELKLDDLAVSAEESS